MPDQPFDLDRTIRVCASASAGPWTTTWPGVVPNGRAAVRVLDGPRYVQEFADHAMDAADAEFIAHARTALPAYAAALNAIQLAHMPRDIYDECDCDDEILEDDPEGRHVHAGEIGWTCNLVATVCRACCCDQDGDQTMECKLAHDHAPTEEYHCATARLAAGVVR